MHKAQDSPIIIAGPTAIGKTSLVKKLRSRIPNVELVSADDYYLYAGDNFWRGLGLTAEDTRTPCNLRGYLRPYQRCSTPDEYVGLASEVVNRIHASGKRAIIEGCNYGYIEALLGHYGLHNAVRVSFRDIGQATLTTGVQRRYDQLVWENLYWETERALASGYRFTYPMSSLIYRPTIRVLDGELTREEAKKIVVRKWVGEIYRTDAKLAHLGIDTCLYPQVEPEPPPNMPEMSFMEQVLRAAGDLPLRFSKAHD